jgi:hypothetical protein
MNEGTNYRIGWGVSILLVVVAIIFDVLSLIPLVGSIAGPLFWVLAGVYFWYKGMGIVNGRKLAVSSISMVAEIIPAVQALPALTVGIIVMLTMMRVEDKTGISLKKPKIPGTTPPRLSRPQFNSQQGIRYPNKN